MLKRYIACMTFSLSTDCLKNALADAIKGDDISDNELYADFVNSYFQ